MLEGRSLKGRKSLGQFEAKGIIDNRNRQQRSDGNTRYPNSMVGLVKTNMTTRIPKKIDTPTLTTSVSSSSHHQQQPLSVPTSSKTVPSPCPVTTTTSPTTMTELTPEIHFLIREHAKTLETINKITNRVDKLDHKIDDICRKVTQIGNNVIKKGESSGTAPNALSDDSGVEYSWTTNGTGPDDDELLSLLNQITKFSASIKNQKCRPIPSEPLAPPKLSASRKIVSSSMDHPRLNECLDSNSAPQSFSALLFESNVEHFLANLDFVPEPVRTSDYIYPPSIPASQLLPSNHRQHHQPVKSHPISATRLLTETLFQPHEQKDQK
ncbi:uncharacterized protein LOC128386149 [Panonychus citri]|uniref:uncharacterized protein LOC128386149 n=1 Tax=Panonychus citri TaxID=50023 RepID=UPI002307DDE0|nr:uncharacterized protein LOC128386149 [Panonychus citri]XP_053201116.1 uncharacterized protein LOC128386149 [Panonychus citri]